MYYKIMSFLKIADPRKRDFLVNQLLETRKKIRDDSLSEQFGDMTRQRELDKIFKPVTSQLAAQQLATQAEIQKQIAATTSLTSAIEGLLSRLAITGAPPANAPLEAPELLRLADELTTAPTVNLGKIATKYLSLFGDKYMKVDKTYGIRFVNDEWKIGNKVVQFNGDNIIIGDTEYNGTPGLWELLTSVNPDPKIFNNTDHVDYKKILIETSAMKQNYDPTSNRPASSKSEKWKNFVGPIWDEYRRTALKAVIILTLSSPSEQPTS